MPGMPGMPGVPQRSRPRHPLDSDILLPAGDAGASDHGTANPDNR